MSYVPAGKIITKKQKLILTTTLVAGTAAALVVNHKYRGAIKAAKATGVTDWIVEMNSRDLVVVALPPNLVDKAFSALAEI